MRKGQKQTEESKTKMKATKAAKKAEKLKLKEQIKTENWQHD